MAYITLNQNNFNNNADYYSNKIGNKNKLCMALKDNAYGHGIEYMAKMCFDYGIKHAIVRDISEALLLKEFDFESIIILYETANKKYDDNFIFSINCLDDISSCIKNTKIELKINTGMGRNGICINEIDEALKSINKNELILNGVFTHFHSADEKNDTAINQEKLFLETVNKIKNKITYKFRIHCSNTAGVHKVNNSLYDIARIGIGMYGYSDTCRGSLKPIMSLYASKISTRVLNKGDGIGYGASYKVLEDNTLVSNYDIGYGDGFFRVNEKQNAYIQDGSKILGRISMDSFSTFGDKKEVCVFSNASHLSKVHDTIEYEILTHLLPRIKRIII